MYLLTLKTRKEDGAYAVQDSHGDKVLFLFEEEDDAERYAMMLEDDEQYQKEMKSNINELLEANHSMGLSMDNFDHQSKVDEIEKFKLLEQDKEAGHTYRMKSAGYGVF